MLLPNSKDTGTCNRNFAICCLMGILEEYLKKILIYHLYFVFIF